MDLIHLIHRESEERQRAAKAVSEPARAAHIALAELFRQRIAIQHELETVGPNA